MIESETIMTVLRKVSDVRKTTVGEAECIRWEKVNLQPADGWAWQRVRDRRAFHVVSVLELKFPSLSVATTDALPVF